MAWSAIKKALFFALRWKKRRVSLDFIDKCHCPVVGRPVRANFAQLTEIHMTVQMVTYMFSEGCHPCSSGLQLSAGGETLHAVCEILLISPGTENE